jgi:hypothetical protein
MIDKDIRIINRSLDMLDYCIIKNKNEERFRKINYQLVYIFLEIFGIENREIDRKYCTKKIWLSIDLRSSISIFHSLIFRVLIKKSLTYRKYTSSIHAKILIVIANTLQIRVKFLIITKEKLEIG